ncbi:acetyl-CoA hydrolase/transferase family protein [Fodinisporobacter ferrooxydans]|uniref:Acetyl-CoA hydrolase/transferase family protein n=1 Tax=Fodinisporobacter ferrooxydans TaxID=2901836 RepID=A0ABY4CY28_9BACL|nr:acetyl-CoA hydrolase/transferase family protein [Alicyclobacillaceae bacterium MYW30-H2]
MEQRIRNKKFFDKIVTAEQAAALIKNGMTVGLSGFTRSGDAKVVPIALAERKKSTNQPLKINVFTGASIGDEVDGILAEADMIHKRLPFQAEKKLRTKINSGDVLFIDQHLSHTAEQIRAGQLPAIDVAIIEAVAITEEGGIVPTTSVGNSSTFAKNAKEIIIELNMAQPLGLEGIHDIYELENRGQRMPIPLTQIDQRIGKTYIEVDPQKVKAIVITEKQDNTSSIASPDAETEQMAGHLIDFFRNEVNHGRLPANLMPLQSGIGSVANAVFHGFLQSEFSDLKVFSEVLQDSVFDLIDAGKISYASACSITLSPKRAAEVVSSIEKYRDKLILRPQEITNHPELIRRLGLICINTALEFDIYGNVNSTHVMGTNMMNGIGGSGDFARNSLLGVFVSKSTAKHGQISSIVPMVSHVDHTEHDVDIVVTEQGLADLRGLAPRERAKVIIENCAHPMYKDALREYFHEACKRGGQTPHMLEQALSWHVRYQQSGSMLAAQEVLI